MVRSKSQNARIPSPTTTAMKKIAILGSGSMGTGMARLLAGSGCAVTFGSRNPKRAAGKVPGVAAGNHADVVRSADIVVLAVPYDAVEAVAGRVGSLAGKIVLDLTNPLTPDYLGLTLGYTTSAGEHIQSLFPKAKVVKAFNTIFSAVLDKASSGAEALPTVLIAGDHRAANEEVADLASRIGFGAEDTGPLSNSRYLEPMAELQIQLAYGKGHGGEVGFTFSSVAAPAAQPSPS